MPDDAPPPDAPKPENQRRKPRRKGRWAVPVVTENRFEVLVLLVLSAALLLSITLFAVLAVASKDPAISSKLADALAYISMLSIGAIGGRLSGKANAPERVEGTGRR
jgi:hypothetical protein